MLPSTTSTLHLNVTRGARTRWIIRSANTELPKRRDRPYQAGRSKHWVKVKNRKAPRTVASVFLPAASCSGLPVPARRAHSSAAMGTKSRDTIFGPSIRASAERAAAARKEADRLACEAWNKRMLGYRGPAQPSPTLGDAVNAG